MGCHENRVHLPHLFVAGNFITCETAGSIQFLNSHVTNTIEFSSPILPEPGPLATHTPLWVARGPGLDRMSELDFSLARQYSVSKIEKKGHLSMNYNKGLPVNEL